jgi:hypothetical protein
MSHIVRFFNLMFPDYLLTDEHLKISVWCHPSSRTKWFESKPEANEYCESVNGKENCYFGLGMIRDIPKQGRGKESDVMALTSMYIDVDVDDGTVKRGKAERLPKTIKEAKRILDAIGLPPSILVFSGHGYQAYWLFKEPLLFEIEADRQSAKMMMRAWNSTARACAASIGYTIDSTFDLARVFRVPGTMNMKGKQPIQSMIVEPEQNDSNIRYYIPDDFEQLFIPDALKEFPQPESLNRVEVSPVRPISQDSIPDIIMVACENDSRFKKTWERKRTDFSKGDTSASAYDMAITSFLVRAGALDQVIADAIYHWRKKHGEDTKKLLRRDYLMKMISKVRSSLKAEVAVADLSSAALDQEPQKTVPESDQTNEQKEERKKLMKDICCATGVPIVRIVKHGRENSMYSFELSNNLDVSIGVITDLLNPDKVRARIADATGVVMRTFKKHIWNDMVAVILRCASLVENISSSRSGMLNEWLTSYLSQSHISFDEDQIGLSVMEMDPYVRGDMLFVHGPTLLRFVRLQTGENIKSSDMADMFRVVGFLSTQVSSRHEGKVFTRSYWSCDIGRLEFISGVITKSKPKIVRTDTNIADSKEGVA